MTIEQIAERMIAFSKGNIHDIDHFLRVWSYASVIAGLEGMDADSRFILEAAAILHDIACPLCREKYGSAVGKLQEAEGEVLAAGFLKDSGLTEEQISRICRLIGHHHTLPPIDGQDMQILIEADYLANASENGYSAANVEAFLTRFFKTESGERLIRAVMAGGPDGSSGPERKEELR